MRALAFGFAVVLSLVCANGDLASAKPVPAGAGTTIFGDVPVAPGSFPDYGPRSFGLRGGSDVRPQAFNFASFADSKSMLTWYKRRLSQHGWHIESLRYNYPYPGASAVVGSRRGEAATVVVEPAKFGCRVSLIKLNTAK